jgi:hypothetical protein
MPNFSSYCTLGSFCQNQSGSNQLMPQVKPTEFLNQMNTAILHDKANQLKPMDKKGVSGPAHYKCLGPKHFVPPLMHSKIGRVNNVCDAFEEWVYDVDIASPHEKDAPEAHSIAKDNLAIVLGNKNEGDQMINIDMRKKCRS